MATVTYDDVVDIGATIKARRQQTGTSLRQLAAMANMSYSHLSRIETGKITPTVATTQQLLALVGYTLTDQRTTQDGAAIAAARKACQPGGSIRWDDDAQQWIRLYQAAGWVDDNGEVKQPRKNELLMRTGASNPITHRKGTRRFRPATASDTWLDQLERIAGSGIPYALTGGPAANQRMPVGGGMDLAIYVENVDAAAQAAKLEEDSQGWIVLAPFNGVYEFGRYLQPTGIYADNVWMVDPDQLVIDCAGLVKRGWDQAEFLTGQRV